MEATEIYIDFEDIGNSLTATERQAILDEIKADLKTLATPQLGIEVKGVPLGGAKAKSGELVQLGGLIMAVTAVGGFTFDPAGTKRLLEVAWKALTRYLSKGTEIRIASQGKSITVKTSNEDAAIAILQAAEQVAFRLSEKPAVAKAASRRAVTITPKRR